MSKLVLSVSRGKIYKDCPRKYYYTYIEKLPRKEWDHFDLGGLVHSILEEFHKDYRSDNDCPENSAFLMKTAFEKSQISFENEKSKYISNEIIEEAKIILRSYMANIRKNGIGGKILCIEEGFTLPLNEKYGVQGFIDRVDLDNDGIYHIKDYKTSKSDKFMEPLQLKVYGMYLLNKFPDLKQFKGSYIMLKLDSKFITYKFNIEDVKEAQNELIDLADKITIEERWLTRPSKLCDWCDFKDTCKNVW